MTRGLLLSLAALGIAAAPFACASNGELFSSGGAGPTGSSTSTSGSATSTSSAGSSSGKGGATSSSSGAGGATSSSGTGGASSSSTGSSTTSASSSSASSAASSTSSSTSASSSSSGGVEICSNNLDDNGNGLVDCADPQCASWICAHKPVNWTGPVAIYTGGQPFPSCPAEYPVELQQLFAGLVPEDALCDLCDCQLPKVTCFATPNLTFYDDAACMNVSGLAPNNPGCGLINPPGGTKAASAPPPQAFLNGLGCMPTGGGATLPPPVWTSAALLCGGAQAGGGCMGDLCEPPPPAPFDAQLCVFQQGQAAQCPNHYPNKTVYVTGVVDTRGCSKCSCGAPGQPTCAATTDLFADDQCQQLADSVPNDGSCHPIGDDKSLHTSTQVISNPGCTPNPGGGQPIGSIVENNKFFTVCCQ